MVDVVEHGQRAWRQGDRGTSGAVVADDGGSQGSSRALARAAGSAQVAIERA